MLENKGNEFSYDDIIKTLMFRGQDDIADKIIELGNQNAEATKLSDAVTSLQERNSDMAAAILKEYGSVDKIPADVTVAKYIQKLKDGATSYDLRDLADKLRNRVGSDFILNRVEDRQRQISEIQACRSLISYELGIPESSLSDEDVVKIVCDLLGYTRQKKDRTPDIAKGVIPLLTGLISAVGSGAAATHKSLGTVIIDASVHVKIDVNVLVEAGINPDLIATAISTSQSGVSSAVVGSSLVIDAPKEIWLNPSFHDFLKGLGAGMLPGIMTAVAGAVIQVAAGNGYQDEEACMSSSDYDKNNSLYTDPDKFKRYLSQRYPDKADMLCQRVDAYTVNGVFDHASFQNDIRENGGLGNYNNPDECLVGGTKKPQIKPDPKQEEVSTSFTEKCSDENSDNTTITEQQQQETEVVENAVGDLTCGSWTMCARNLYPGLLEAFGNDMWAVKRALKIADAIKGADEHPERLSLKNLKELVEASRRSGNLAKYDYIDMGRYSYVLNMNIMPKDYSLKPSIGGLNLGFDLTPQPAANGLTAEQATQAYINAQLKELICDDTITNKEAANDKAKKYLKEIRRITVLGKEVKVIEVTNEEKGNKTKKCIYQVRLGNSVVDCNSLAEVTKKINEFNKKYEGTDTRVTNRGEQSNEDFNTEREVDHSKDKK